LKPINIVITILIALIVVTALSAVLFGVEQPVVDAITQSSAHQTEISQCLDQNPELTYDDCSRQVGEQ